MKILFVTNMFPTADNPVSGPFVKNEVEALRAVGHTVDIIIIHGKKSRINYLLTAPKVFYNTLRQKYDIVHAHYGISGFPALFRWRTPLVITLRGSDVLVGNLQPFISRFVCRFADAVIAVTDEISTRIPATVIPSGLNLSLFKRIDKKSAREYLGLPLDVPLILFPFDPSRLVKRYDLAKEVVRRLRLQGWPDARLLIPKSLPQSEMPWYYSAADAMLLCSDSEGSPNSIKEALACDLPVVSTDVGAVREILKDIEGVIISDQNVFDLANSLNEVLTFSKTFGFQSHPAMKKYDQAVITNSILKVYKWAIEYYCGNSGLK